MRQVLFGSTALVGAILLASAASAQTAGPKAPFRAILDGEVNANFGILSGTQNGGTNGGHQRDFGVEQNAWLRFYFEAKADNGLTYGWNVRMITTSSSISNDGFSNDREGIYMEHPQWGGLNIGDDASTSKSNIPTVIADWGPPTSSQSYLGPGGKIEALFLQFTDARAFAIANNAADFGAFNNFPSGRAMHIYYETPRFYGWNLETDYTPDGATRNEEQFVTSTASGVPSATQSVSEANFQNVVSLNAQGRGEYMGVAWGLVAQYAHGQSKNIFSATGSGQAFRDINSYESGVKLNYAGFQFGLEWTYLGQSAVPKAISGGTGPIGKPVNTWGWATGLEYFMGPWVIGGYYWYGYAPGTFQLSPAGTALATTTVATANGLTSPQTAGNGAFEDNNYGIGVGYTLAPGLKLYSELFYYDYYNTHLQSTASNSGRHMNGQVYIFGTSLAW